MGLKAAPGAGGLLDLLTEENSSILLPGSSSDKDDANVLQRTLSHILDLSPGEQLSIKNSTDVRHLLEERYAAVSPQLEPGEVPAGRVGPRRVAVEPSSSFSMSTPDLCIESLTNFSSFRANTAVFAGKWMYEVTLLTAGIQQLGWATLQCPFRGEEGVGDAPDSYAYDGKRLRKWNVKSGVYGQAWTTGDIIGCCIDLDKGEVSFYRNGHFLGVAFSNVRTMPTMIAYFPAGSLSHCERCQLNFGARPFEHPVEGFLPIELPPKAAQMRCGKELMAGWGRLAQVVAQSAAQDAARASGPTTEANSSASTTTTAGEPGAGEGETLQGCASAAAEAAGSVALTAPTPESLTVQASLAGLSAGPSLHGPGVSSRAVRAAAKPPGYCYLPWEEGIMLASLLAQYLVPYLVQPYFISSLLLPELLSLHGSRQPHDPRSTLHALSLLHAVCDTPTFERVVQGLLEALPNKCATSCLRAEQFPFSAAYPWLSLTCCILRLRSVRSIWLGHPNLQALLERTMTRKPPTNDDLKALLKFVWWPGCEDEEHTKQQMEETMAGFTGTLARVEEKQAQLLGLLAGRSSKGLDPTGKEDALLTYLRCLLLKNRGSTRDVPPPGLSDPTLLISTFFALLRLLRPVLPGLPSFPAGELFVKNTWRGDADPVNELGRLGGVVSHLLREAPLSHAQLAPVPVPPPTCPLFQSAPADNSTFSASSSSSATSTSSANTILQASTASPATSTVTNSTSTIQNSTTQPAAPAGISECINAGGQQPQPQQQQQQSQQAHSQQQLSSDQQQLPPQQQQQQVDFIPNEFIESEAEGELLIKDPSAAQPLTLAAALAASTRGITIDTGPGSTQGGAQGSTQGFGFYQGSAESGAQGGTTQGGTQSAATQGGTKHSSYRLPGELPWNWSSDSSISPVMVRMRVSQVPELISTALILYCWRVSLSLRTVPTVNTHLQQQIGNLEEVERLIRTHGDQPPQPGQRNYLREARVALREEVASNVRYARLLKVVFFNGLKYESLLEMVSWIARVLLAIRSRGGLMGYVPTVYLEIIMDVMQALRKSNDPQLDRLTAPVGPNGSCGLSDVLALLIAEMSDTRIATPDTKEQLVACIASLLDHPSSLAAIETLESQPLHPSFSPPSPLLLPPSSSSSSSAATAAAAAAGGGGAGGGTASTTTSNPTPSTTNSSTLSANTNATATGGPSTNHNSTSSTPSTNTNTSTTSSLQDRPRLVASAVAVFDSKSWFPVVAVLDRIVRGHGFGLQSTAEPSRPQQEQGSVQGQGPEQGSVTGDALNSGSQHQQQQQQSAITTDGVSSGTHHQQQQQQEGLASASTAPPPPQGGARSLRYSRMRGSAVLQAQLAAEIGSGSERARGFYNRLFNTLGWALTECAVQITELADLSGASSASGLPRSAATPAGNTPGIPPRPPAPGARRGVGGARPEASLAEEQALQRRVGIMFELVVQLLRLLEFAVTQVGAAAFAPGSMNMQRLLELVPFVLGHFATGPDARRLDALLQQVGQRQEQEGLAQSTLLVVAQRGLERSILASKVKKADVLAPIVGILLALYRKPEFRDDLCSTSPSKSSTQAGGPGSTDDDCTRRGSIGGGTATSPVVALARSGGGDRLAEQLEYLRKVDWAAAFPHGSNSVHSPNGSHSPQGSHLARDLADLEALCKEFEDARAAAKAGAGSGGSGGPGGSSGGGEDPPEEFLDPITYMVMRDPVKLPDSGVIVDRSTIERHLLSQATDPFSRKPLILDQLIPDTQLADKIKAWRRGGPRAG